MYREWTRQGVQYPVEENCVKGRTYPSNGSFCRQSLSREQYGEWAVPILLGASLFFEWHHFGVQGTIPRKATFLFTVSFPLPVGFYPFSFLGSAFVPCVYVGGWVFMMGVPGCPLLKVALARLRSIAGSLKVPTFTTGRVTS